MDVILAATLVHVALSITYGIVLSRLISGLRIPMSLAVGIVSGLCLYTVNMYGFTIVFPWFEASRDWVTVATHAVFGGATAGVYQALLRWQQANARPLRRAL